MPTICLIVLIGLPAAGKTSLCKELNQKLNDTEDYKCHTVIYDNILEESIKICATSFQNQYKESRNTAFTLIEDKIISIISRQDDFKKHVIIIDDNMYYKSMRFEYYKLAKKYKTSFLQIYINVSLETAILRNSKREEKYKVPESIIRDMANKLEAPPGNENWQLNSLILDSNEKNLAVVMQALKKSMEVPVFSQEGTNKTGSLPASILQSIDLQLRKIVHKKINVNKKLVEMYINKKKDIFQKIKEQQIVVGTEMNETQVFNYLESLF